VAPGLLAPHPVPHQSRHRDRLRRPHRGLPVRDGGGAAVAEPADDGPQAWDWEQRRSWA
jgi:hypothetical protein